MRDLLVGSREETTVQLVRMTPAWRTGWWSGVFFMAGAVGWLLASPIGSIPDEPSHFVRAAAVVRGQIDLPPSATRPGIEEASVPAYVDEVFGRTCYASRPELTADCDVTPTRDPNETVDSVTTAGLNAPIFYAVVGLPSKVLSGDAALLSMRAMSALWCALVWGWAFASLMRVSPSRFLALGSFLAATPMLQYLAGSVNPNGVEAVGALAVFAGLVAMTRSAPGAAVRGAPALVVMGAVMVSSARTVGLLWIPIAVGAALAMAERRRVAELMRSRLTWIVAGISAVPAIASVFWFLSQRDDSAPGPIAAPMTAPEAMRQVVEHSLSYARGYVGLFGWLDTSLPTLAYVAYGAVAIALGGLALVVSSGARRWAVATLAMLIVVLPVGLQGVLAPSVGFIWQGRYLLAVVVLVAVASVLVLERWVHEDRVAFRVVGVSGVLIVLVSWGAFVLAIRRYTVGLRHPVIDILGDTPWQPPVPVAVLVAMYGLVVAAWGMWALVNAAPARGDVVVTGSKNTAG